MLELPREPGFSCSSRTLFRNGSKQLESAYLNPRQLFLMPPADDLPDTRALAPRRAHGRDPAVPRHGDPAACVRDRGERAPCRTHGDQAADFPAPQPVVEAAITKLKHQPMGYTDALGIRPLREAIAQFYADRYRLTVAPERIVLTAGALGAFLIAMGSLIGPGDEVLAPDPATRQPSLRADVRGKPEDDSGGCGRALLALGRGRAAVLAGADTRCDARLALQPDRHRVPSMGCARSSPRPKPAPASRSSTRSTRGSTYDGPHFPTALGLSDRVFVVNSFSKYFCMTGWRLGWLGANGVVREMEHSRRTRSSASPARTARGAAAFSPATIMILEERRAEFQRRRDFLVPARCVRWVLACL